MYFLKFVVTVFILGHLACTQAFPTNTVTNHPPPILTFLDHARFVYRHAEKAILNYAASALAFVPGATIVAVDLRNETQKVIDESPILFEVWLGNQTNLEAEVMMELENWINTSAFQSIYNAVNTTMEAVEDVSEKIGAWCEGTWNSITQWVNDTWETIVICFHYNVRVVEFIAAVSAVALTWKLYSKFVYFLDFYLMYKSDQQKLDNAVPEQGKIETQIVGRAPPCSECHKVYVERKIRDCEDCAFFKAVSPGQ